MPRIRTLKPEIWQDEALGRCPQGARLLYVGMITQADDEGRLRSAPPLLRSAIFPYDESLTSRRISEWLGALADAQLIRAYTARGESYAELTGWHHQKVDRPSPSTIPTYEQRDKSRGTEPKPPNAGDSPKPRRDLDERSTQARSARGGSGIKDQGRDQGSGIKDHGTNRAREIFDHWTGQPGLIQHKALTSDTEKAIRKALAEHSPGDVREAISLYSTVLQSERHYWSHRWPLAEFLNRGLGRFLPEAQPLVAMLVRDDPNGSQPRRKPTTEDEIAKACRIYTTAVQNGDPPSEAATRVRGIFPDQIADQALAQVALDPDDVPI